MIIDSHCHLDYEPMSLDLNQTISRANKDGVEFLLTISTTDNSNPQCLLSSDGLGSSERHPRYVLFIVLFFKLGEVGRSRSEIPSPKRFNRLRAMFAMHALRTHQQGVCVVADNEVTYIDLVCSSSLAKQTTLHCSPWLLLTY